MRYTLGLLMAISLLWMLMVFGVLGLVGANLEWFNAGNFFTNFHSAKNLTFWTPWQTWDAQAYLAIAEQGYDADQRLAAYYPLFPGLAHLVAAIFKVPTLCATFLVTNAAFLLSVALLYDLVRRRFTDRIAFWAVVLLQVMPFAFFFRIAYAESLFLCLVLLLFWALQKKSWPALVAAALLLPLTRVQGALLFIPAAVGLWQQQGSPKQRWVRLLALATAFTVGIGIYFAGFTLALGDPFSGFAAQQFFVSQNQLGQLLHPIDWLRNTWGPARWNWQHLPGFSAYDRLWFLGYLLLLPGIFKKLPREWAVYAAVVGLLPALTGPLMSFPRYTVVLFPIVVFFAVALRGRAALLLPLSVLLGMSQLALLFLHSQNLWVA